MNQLRANAVNVREDERFEAIPVSVVEHPQCKAETETNSIHILGVL